MLACHGAIHLRSVGHRLDGEALFGKIAIKQTAQAGVIVYYQDAKAFFVHGRIVCATTAPVSLMQHSAWLKCEQLLRSGALLTFSYKLLPNSHTDLLRLVEDVVVTHVRASQSSLTAPIFFRTVK